MRQKVAGIDGSISTQTGGIFPLEILEPAPTLGLLRQSHPYRGALRVSICLSAAMASELERVARSPFIAHSSGG